MNRNKKEQTAVIKVEQAGTDITEADRIAAIKIFGYDMFGSCLSKFKKEHPGYFGYEVRYISPVEQVMNRIELKLELLEDALNMKTKGEK